MRSSSPSRMTLIGARLDITTSLRPARTSPTRVRGKRVEAAIRSEVAIRFHRVREERFAPLHEDYLIVTRYPRPRQPTAPQERSSTDACFLLRVFDLLGRDNPPRVAAHPGRLIKRPRSRSPDGLSAVCRHIALDFALAAEAILGE